MGGRGCSEVGPVTEEEKNLYPILMPALSQTSGIKRRTITCKHGCLVLFLVYASKCRAVRYFFEFW